MTYLRGCVSPTLQYINFWAKNLSNSLFNDIWYHKKCYIRPNSDLAAQGFELNAIDVGDTCLVVFSYHLFRELLKIIPNIIDLNWPYNTTELKLCITEGGRFTIHFPSYGATRIASSLEQLSALGITKVFGVGLGGTPQETINIGDIVLLEGSIKGDGVSRYYSPIEFPAVPDFGLVSKIQTKLSAHNENYHIGLSFGTDALYREEENLVSILREFKVLLIDLESSAFFTVARRLNLLCCWVGIVSDRFIAGKHEGIAHSESVINELLNLSNYIIQVIEETFITQ